MPTIQIEIPTGDHCMFEPKRTCKLAVWNKYWHAYNCRGYNLILKGGDTPKKCRECKECEAPHDA